ncbi:MAG TPA: RNA polymerase sigma factor [Flavipsychrobacter sp.]
MKPQEQEFTTLIQQHERLVYKVCSLYAADAEDLKDLFQEIVLQAWSGYTRFRNESAISTWLYRVALNTAITHKRKKSRQLGTPVADMQLLHVADASSQAYAEEYAILQKLVGSLPPLEKALILLYFEDRSYQEIADIMGISVSNVGTRLARIKEKLKKQAQPFITQ